MCAPTEGNMLRVLDSLAKGRMCLEYLDEDTGLCRMG